MIEWRIIAPKPSTVPMRVSVGDGRLGHAAARAGAAPGRRSGSARATCRAGCRGARCRTARRAAACQASMAGTRLLRARRHVGAVVVEPAVAARPPAMSGSAMSWSASSSGSVQSSCVVVTVMKSPVFVPLVGSAGPAMAVDEIVGPPAGRCPHLVTHLCDGTCGPAIRSVGGSAPCGGSGPFGLKRKLSADRQGELML